MFNIKKMSLLLLLTTVCSCSSVPVGTKFHTPTQKKMQAARHWDVLANDISHRIKNLIDKNQYISPMPVYLETADNSSFGTTFKQMLRYNLFKLGYSMTDNPDTALRVRYDSRLLHHRADRLRGDFDERAMAAGVATFNAGAALGIIEIASDVYYNHIPFSATQGALTGAAIGLMGAGLIETIVASQFTGITNTELIFLAEIYSGGDLKDMYLDIYYINSEDAYQYIAQQNKTFSGPTSTVLSSKRIKVDP